MAEAETADSADSHYLPGLEVHRQEACRGEYVRYDTAITVPAHLPPLNRVFLSSTYKDLLDHREMVLSSLRKAGVQIDPMETWTADAREPRMASVDRVCDCDLFILVVARRRGFIPSGCSESITQLEYREARRLNKPVLVFLLKDDEPWRSEFDERRDDPSVEKWRSELLTSHVVEYFGLAPSSIDVMPAVYRAGQIAAMGSGTETEYKLAAPSNTQFKFATIQHPTWVIRRLLDICAKQGLQCSPPEMRKITDTYYDDERHTLAAHGQLIRTRLEQGQTTLTCKSSEQTINRALHRNEVELSCDSELATLLASGRIPERIVSLFWNKMGTHLGRIGVPFGPVLLVHNERVEIALRTDTGRYKFCYDRYYYEAEADFSEYFSEIEIETDAQLEGDDPKLGQLLETLQLLTEYEFQASSKYSRGIDWLRLRNEFTQLWSLVCEVPGLEGRPPTVQKQVLQTLSHYVKLGLSEIGYDITSLMHSPHPAGLVLSFERVPKLIVDALRFAHRQICEVYNCRRTDYAFQFRAALGRCEAIRYSGVTEDLILSNVGLGEVLNALKDAPIASVVVCPPFPREVDGVSGAGPISIGA